MLADCSSAVRCLCAGPAARGRPTAATCRAVPDADGQAVHQDVHQLTTMRRYPKLKYPITLEAQGLQPAHATQSSSSSTHSGCPRDTRTTGMRTSGTWQFNMAQVPQMPQTSLMARTDKVSHNFPYNGQLKPKTHAKTPEFSCKRLLYGK